MTLAVLVVLLVTAGAGTTAGAADRSAWAPGDEECTYGEGWSRVWLDWSDGLAEQLGRDLIVCTDAAGASYWVHNTSSTVLWTVDNPQYPYWLPSTDQGKRAAVQVFREALRQIFGGAGPAGFLTIEPGVAAVIPSPTFRVTLYPDLQALWSSTKLVVDRVQTKVREVLERVLRAGSRTRGVAVTCAIEGFEVGRQMADTGADPSQLLAAGLGLAQSASSSRCVQAVRELEEELRKPRVTVASLRKAVQPASTWSAVMDTPLLAALRRIGTVI